MEEIVSKGKDEPRRRRDSAAGGRLLIGYGLVIAGGVMLGVGWYGVSGQPIVSGQLSYVISGGLGGLLAGIVGVGLLVSYDVRRDRERLGRVEAAMLEIRQLLLTQAQSEEARVEAPTRPQGGRRATEPEEAAG
jgi:hypothetical protein